MVLSEELFDNWVKPKAYFPPQLSSARKLCDGCAAESWVANSIPDHGFRVLLSSWDINAELDQNDEIIHGSKQNFKIPWNDTESKLSE